MATSTYLVTVQADISLYTSRNSKVLVAAGLSDLTPLPNVGRSCISLMKVMKSTTKATHV